MHMRGPFGCDASGSMNAGTVCMSGSMALALCSWVGLDCSTREPHARDASPPFHGMTISEHGGEHGPAPEASAGPPASAPEAEGLHMLLHLAGLCAQS